jgi:hypothetical protein
MKTTIRITLEVEVEPFTREQLEAEGFEGEDAEPGMDPEDDFVIADGIVSHISQEEYAAEMLAGSMCFVTITGAKWVDVARAQGSVAEGGAA